MSDRIYDFIIVGSGSAGSVLARRLSADSANQVLVLEAGAPDYWWDARIFAPAAYAFMVGNPQFDWNYVSEPEPFMHDRRLTHPRGKVLGGSSTINGMNFQRGHPYDFDRWAGEPGVEEWSYAHCLPYFKRLESSDSLTLDGNPNRYRGFAGPQIIERSPAAGPLFQAFFEAAGQAGYSIIEDINGPPAEGFAHYDRTVQHARRVSTARSFLHPVLRRPNLTLRCRARVTKVVVESGQARGVEYLDWRGKVHRVRTGAVVLAGGAIASPQLLQLSGVGPAAELSAVGVPVVHDLPGVGRHLQDHLTTHIQHACTQPITLGGALRDRKQWPGIVAKWLFTRSGPAASNVIEAGAFLRSSKDQPIPDLALGFGAVSMQLEPDRPVDVHGYQLHVSHMRLEARGRVSLKSSDPLAQPSLLYNYLSTEADRSFWLNAYRIARDVLSQPAFAPYDAGETFPGFDRVNSDAEVLAWVADRALTGLHPTSSCRMGIDAESVVDPATMAVHGLRGLYLADASVMPYCTNGATHAPSMMLAERASDLILGLSPLPPEGV